MTVNRCIRYTKARYTQLTCLFSAALLTEICRHGLHGSASCSCTVVQAVVKANIQSNGMGKFPPQWLQNP